MGNRPLARKKVFESQPEKRIKSSPGEPQGICNTKRQDHKDLSSRRMGQAEISRRMSRTPYTKIRAKGIEDSKLSLICLQASPVSTCDCERSGEQTGGGRALRVLVVLVLTIPRADWRGISAELCRAYVHTLIEPPEDIIVHGSMVGCVPEAKLEPAVALGQ